MRRPRKTPECRLTYKKYTWSSLLCIIFLMVGHFWQWHFLCAAPPARQRRYQEEQPAFFPLCMRISLRNTTPFPIWRKRGAIVLLCKKSFLDLSICQPHQDVYFIQSRRHRCYCRSRVKVQTLLLRLNKETRCAQWGLKRSPSNIWTLSTIF